MNDTADTLSISVLHAAAWRRYQEGQFNEAERLCGLILAKGRDGSTMHLLGLIAYQRGRLEDAGFFLAAAIGAPSGEGEPDPRRAEGGPAVDAAAVCNDLGTVLQARGLLDEAVRHHAQAIALRPDYAEAHFNLANALHALERLEEAVEAYQAAIALRPAFAEAHNNLGNALQTIGYLGEAAGAYRRALTLRPDLSEAHSNLGKVLQELGEKPEAIESYQRAIALNERNPEACNNLGNALVDLGRDEEAITWFEQAIALRPEFSHAHYNLGNARFVAGELPEAVAAYRKALAVAPDYPNAHINLGNALMGLDRVHEALACYQRAGRLTGNNADATFGEALARLALGSLREGWKAYEARLRIPEITPMADRYGYRPPWRGEAGLRGQTILLHSEQGFGDTIQFARYAPLLALRGANVVVEVRPELHRLMESLHGVAKVLALGDPLPPFDVQCPLMSLPYAFGTDLPDIPADGPYLRPPADLLSPWRDRLGLPKRLRVGIAWSGNPNFRNDRNRSILAETLEPLLRTQGCAFHVLQKDIRHVDYALVRSISGLSEHQARLTDFAQTAALVDLMDVVITADTAIAHLAGALGKRTWILLPFAADWRWLRDKERSPWYPTARLFRQSEAGGWSGVIGSATAALTKLIAASTAGLLTGP